MRRGRRAVRGESSAARAWVPTAPRLRGGNPRSARGPVKERDLQAVFGGRAEETQRAIDLEHVTVAHVPLDPVKQAMKLESTKELAIPRGALVADFDLDLHRSQEDCLRKPHVIAVDQPLGLHVVERQHAVLVAQVGEERGLEGFWPNIEFVGDGAQDFVAAKGPAVARSRPAGSHLPAVVRRRRENLFADHVRSDIGYHLKLGAVLKHLGQPTINLRRPASSAKERVDFTFDLAAGHADPFAKEEQQALGRLEPAQASRSI